MGRKARNSPMLSAIIVNLKHARVRIPLNDLELIPNKELVRSMLNFASIGYWDQYEDSNKKNSKKQRQFDKIAPQIPYKMTSPDQIQADANITIPENLQPQLICHDNITSPIPQFIAQKIQNNLINSSPFSLGQQPSSFSNNLSSQFQFHPITPIMPQSPNLYYSSNISTPIVTENSFQNCEKTKYVSQPNLTPSLANFSHPHNIIANQNSTVNTNFTSTQSLQFTRILDIPSSFNSTTVYKNSTQMPPSTDVQSEAQIIPSKNINSNQNESSHSIFLPPLCSTTKSKLDQSNKSTVERKIPSFLSIKSLLS